MLITRYKKERLMHNDFYPVEFSHEIVDQWQKACEDDELATLLRGTAKRCALSSPIFEHEGVKFRAKYYCTLEIRRKLSALFFSPESVRNLKASIKVEKAGMLTPKPLCVWGNWRMGLHNWSVLFVQDLGDLPTLPDFLISIDPGDVEEKRRVSIQLGRALAQLHEADIYVHDPSKNILIDSKDENISFFFIDFDTVLPYRILTRKRVARVLRHCIRPKGRLQMFRYEERVEYVNGYLEYRGHSEWFDSIFPLV